MSCSLNGKFVLAGFESTLEVLDSENGQTLNRLSTVHKKGIIKIEISKYGNYFLTIGANWSVVQWDGSTLEPKKKFTLNSKTQEVKLAQFNQNETQVFIVTCQEITRFKINAKQNEKELKRVQLKDREIEGAYIIESLGILLTADSQNFISAYDLQTLERVNLSQKQQSVNFIKCFNDNKIWIGFSDNTLAVYPIENDEIYFGTKSKKMPFEILEIVQLNQRLFLAVGFSNQVAVLSDNGNFLTTLITFEESLFLKKMTFHQQTRKLTIATQLEQVQCFQICDTAEVFVLKDFLVRINDISQIEISKIDSEFEKSSDIMNNYSLNVNGKILSVDYNSQSYLAILVQNQKNQKLKLIESKKLQKILNNFQDKFQDDLFDNDFFRILSQKTLNLKFPEPIQQIQVSSCEFIFVTKQSIIQTDFQLNILRRWEFDNIINTLKVQSGLKRKENGLLTLDNGTIMQVYLNNPFPVQLLDYKIQIKHIEYNIDNTKILIIDKNNNFVCFEYNPQTVNLKQFDQSSGIISASFNKSNSNIYYYLTNENNFTISYKGESFSTIRNFIDLQNEEIINFQRSVIIVKNNKNNQIRNIQISIKNILNYLIEKQRFREALDLVLSISNENQSLLKELAIKSMENKSEITQEILIYCKDLKLNFLVKEILNQQEEKSKAEIQAELLAYQGKVFKAVQTLIDNQQIGKAIEIFITLGEYEKAAQILKNPVHQQYLIQSKFNLNQIILFQAEDAFVNGQTQLALELYQKIKQYEKVADVLIKNNKQQELIDLVRTLGLDNKSQKVIQKILKYFLDKRNLVYAKECLIKLDDKENLIKMYVENEQFDEALRLYNQISKEKNYDKELLFIPYAEYLMGQNKFQESLEQFKKIGKINLCVDIIELMIIINKQLRNYSVVANLTFEYDQIKNQQFQNEGKFYLFLSQIKNLSQQVYYQEQDKQNVKIFMQQLLCLVISTMPENLDKESKQDILLQLQTSLEDCISQRRINYGKFFLNTLMTLDQGNQNISKFKFSLDILHQSSRDQVFFYQCLQCDTKGFENQHLTCQNCKLNLFYCTISGKQLPLIELKINKDEEMQKLTCSEILQKKVELTSQNQWSDQNLNENQQFCDYIQKNYQFQQNKGIVEIQQIYDLQHMNLDQFIDYQSKKYFYLYDQNVGICICQNCDCYYDVETFEQYSPEFRCLLCSKDDFFSFV